MSKFLTLIEEFDPNSQSDPKWDLIDFLKSKGVPVSLVQGTDMVYIDTGSKTIPVTVSQTQEDDESSSMLDDIANDKQDKFQTPAAQVVKQRQVLAPKIIQNAKQRIGNVTKELNRPVNTLSS